MQALAENAASNKGVPDKDQAAPLPCTAAKPACAADSPPESAAPNTDTSPAAAPAGPAAAASSQAEAADVADMLATSTDQAGAATLSGTEQVQQAAKQCGAAKKARNRLRKQVRATMHGLKGQPEMRLCQHRQYFSAALSAIMTKHARLHQALGNLPACLSCLPVQSRWPDCRACQCPPC